MDMFTMELWNYVSSNEFGLRCMYEIRWRDEGMDGWSIYTQMFSSIYPLIPREILHGYQCDVYITHHFGKASSPALPVQAKMKGGK